MCDHRVAQDFFLTRVCVGQCFVCQTIAEFGIRHKHVPRRSGCYSPIFRCPVSMLPVNLSIAKFFQGGPGAGCMSAGRSRLNFWQNVMFGGQEPFIIYGVVRNVGERPGGGLTDAGFLVVCFRIGDLVGGGWGRAQCARWSAVSSAWREGGCASPDARFCALCARACGRADISGLALRSELEFFLY